MADFTPINTQEEFNAAIANRLKREQETVSKQFQAQITERDEKITAFEGQIADLNKQIESLNAQGTKVTELEAKVREYETAALKTRIAREAGLPLEMADRIKGMDEAAMKADADDFAKLIKAKKVAPMHTTEDGGGSGDGKDAVLKDLLKRFREQ